MFIKKWGTKWGTAKICGVRLAKQHSGESGGNKEWIMEQKTRQGVTAFGTGWGYLMIFLFGKVMQNPELCKELLQLIFPELEIDHIKYPELQWDG